MIFYKFIKFILIISLLVICGQSSYAGNVEDAQLEYANGVDYYTNGDIEKAAESFKRATELDPDYIDAYFNLGSLLEYLKRDKAALDAFKQVILRKPDDYESLYKAAVLSKNMGDIDKARMYLGLIPQESEFGMQAKELAQTLAISSSAAKSSYSQLMNEIPKVSYEQPQNANAGAIQSSNADSYKQSNMNTNAGASQASVGSGTNLLNPSFGISNSNGVYENIPSPTGIAADNSGNLYVAAFSDNVIYKITPDNKKLIYIKDSKIDGPIGIAIDSQKNIYIANYNRDNVLKVSSGGEITEFIPDVKNPYCMFVAGGMLFVSSQGDNSVLRVRLR